MGFRPLGAAYPWDAVVPYRERAGQHPGGLVDLSIGTPVDPTPALVQHALAEGADAPGYPTTHGTAGLREAVAAWYERRRGVPDLDPAAIMPTVGSKEFVAALPSLLGLGAGDLVVIPTAAYPTYEVGARLAGCEVLASDDPAEWADRSDVALVWINSPANPTGAVLGIKAMAAIVSQARDLGAVVASDECYAELPWAPRWAHGGVPCVLDPRVRGESLEGLLSVYSLSKQSNLAGYRAAFVAGDPALVDSLVQLRRHMGMIVPAPVQNAMRVVLGNDAHVQEQRALYARRREVLLEAVRSAGLEVDHSEAGLYLWARPGAGFSVGSAPQATPESSGPGASPAPGADQGAAGARAVCWDVLDWLADRGILAGPGIFYGPAASGHVRLALTASDERVDEAARRLHAG